MRPVLFMLLACLAASAQLRRVEPPPAVRNGLPAEAQPPKPAPVVLKDASSEDQAPVFRSSTALVRIDTQVLAAGRSVAGLTQSDFVVLDETRPVPLESFGRESDPLQLILLFDVSGSMNRFLVEMSTVAGRALAALKPGDQVAVLVFGRRMVPLLEFTPDLRAAARMVQEAPLERNVGAGTNMNGAIVETLDWLRKQPAAPGRRALVVLTDNRGMHYQAPDDKVLRALAGLDVTLNAIVAPGTKPPKPEKLAPNANPDFTPPDVFRLARETGGDVLRADRAGASFVEMMERVRLRYDLAIRPQPGPEGSFRHLEVRLSDAARARYPKAEVRARTGYYTLPAGQ